MKNKAMKILLITTMILGSSGAIAGDYQNKTASGYDTAPKDIPDFQARNNTMHRMNKEAAGTGTWTVDKKSPRTTDSIRNIKKAQKVLNKKGFKVGPEDGVIGQRTRSAIMDYQNEHDLTATGSLNRETLKRMNIPTSFRSRDSNLYSE
jgi:peptidoglycan hydrolase-like protein with peptidoglycan-binding domain